MKPEYILCLTLTLATAAIGHAAGYRSGFNDGSQLGRIAAKIEVIERLVDGKSCCKPDRPTGE